MFFNHLLVTLILIKVLNLDRNQAFLAIVFGVLIDLDHLMGLPAYVISHGWPALLSVDTFMHNEIVWKSAMHGAGGFFVVLGISLVLRMYVPFMFWGLHMVMDWTQTTFWGIVSWPEFVFLALFGGILAVMMWTDYCDARSITHSRNESPSYVQYVCNNLSDLGRDVLPLERIPNGIKGIASTIQNGSLREGVSNLSGGERPPLR